MPLHKQVPGSAADWLARAKSDLAIAKAPLPEGVNYEDLCFHAQQAAEKALKAVYQNKFNGFKLDENQGIFILSGSILPCCDSPFTVVGRHRNSIEWNWVMY